MCFFYFRSKNKRRFALWKNFLQGITWTLQTEVKKITIKLHKWNKLVFLMHPFLPSPDACMLPAQSLLRRSVSLSLHIIAIPATWNIVSFYKYRAPSMQLWCTDHCCCTWFSCIVLKTQQWAIPCPRGSFCIYCRATGVSAQPGCSQGAVVQVAYGTVRDTRREIQCCRAGYLSSFGKRRVSRRQQCDPQGIFERDLKTVQQ